jgi:hypothetical protein
MEREPILSCCHPLSLFLPILSLFSWAAADGNEQAAAGGEEQTVEGELIQKRREMGKIGSGGGGPT